jgi:hypothetical protein
MIFLVVGESGIFSQNIFNFCLTSSLYQYSSVEQLQLLNAKLLANVFIQIFNIKRFSTLVSVARKATDGNGEKRSGKTKSDSRSRCLPRDFRSSSFWVVRMKCGKTREISSIDGEALKCFSPTRNYREPLSGAYRCCRQRTSINDELSIKLSSHY